MNVSSFRDSNLLLWIYRFAAFALWAPVVALGTPSGATAQTSCPVPAADSDLSSALNDVRYLAADALEGREVGTPGAACAADYIADRFRRLRLNPPTSAGGYFQEFTVTTGAELAAENRLVIDGETYTLGEDWIPYGFSASNEVEGTLLYGGLGMPGQILVVDAPDPRSPAAGAMESDPHFLAVTAARHGTAALVVILPEGAGLPDPARETRPKVSIPVVAVAGTARAQVRESAGQMTAAAVTAGVQITRRTARNVVALLEGADPTLRDELVIVGAHYDHLGLGGEGSLSPDAYGEVHNGADDNASGTAVVLEVATRLANAAAPARSVLFMAFAGEEKGLLGSAHYVDDPLVPLDRTVAMMNMDMVGRLNGGTLTVFGVATAEEWETTITGANSSLSQPLSLALLPDGFGPSDHSSFYGEGIPVLHFFTNAHEDYHRPSDDWDKIDNEGLLSVADLVAEVTRRVAGAGSSTLALTPVEGAGNPHGGSVPSGDPQDSGGGYGPYLGTIPDMSPQDRGVRLTGVREGSPAAQAGIVAGDVIIEFGGEEITDLYAYTYALRAREAGDQVRIVVLRDGARVELTAVLGQRR